MKEFILGDNDSDGFFLLKKKINKIIKREKSFLFIGQGNIIDIKEKDIHYLSTVYNKKTFDLFTELNEKEISKIILELIDEDDGDFSCQKLIEIVFDFINFMGLSPISISDFKNMFTYVSLENMQINLKELENNKTNTIEEDIKYFINNSQDFYSEKLDLIFDMLHSIEKLNVGDILSKEKNPLWNEKQIYIQTRSTILKKIILSIAEEKDIEKLYIIQNFGYSMDRTTINRLLNICKNKQFIFSEEDTLKMPKIIRKAFLSTADKIFYMEEREENYFGSKK